MVFINCKVLGLCLAFLGVAASTSINLRHQEQGPLPMANVPPCQSHNLKLHAFLKAASEETGQTLLPNRATNLDEFVLEVKNGLDKVMLSERPIEYLFSDHAMFNPTCNGIWAEFGVASGGTINLAAAFRQAHCSASCPHVNGFDTFTGLPERWVMDTTGGSFQEHAFDQGGAQGGYPTVEPNVNLIKGLFNNSLPAFLRAKEIYSGLDEPLSFLHIDCDLYAGARDALQILTPRIAVGTVIVFDDLINYELFRDHEIKALWEWTITSGARLLPVGVKGPLPGKSEAMQLDWSSGDRAADWFHQSAMFVVAHIDPPRVNA